MGSKIEKLNKDFRLPFDEVVLQSGDPIRLAHYLRELVTALQTLLEDINKIVNFGIDLTDGEALYLALKDSTGEYPIGTWRFIVAVAADVTLGDANAAGDLMVQRKTGFDIWTTARIDHGS